MASSVATPLERQFGRIAGITEMTSSSTLGTTSITLQFDLDRDIDGAARDVQAAINAARSYLPANLPSNPTYRKVNPADAPDHDHRPYFRRLRPRARSTTPPPPIMSQRLSQIRRRRAGERRRQFASRRSRRTQSDPAQQLRPWPAGRRHHAQQPECQSRQRADSRRQPSRRHPRQRPTPERRPVPAISIVGYHNGAAIKLSDIADVAGFGVENIRAAGFVNGKPCRSRSSSSGSPAQTSSTPSTSIDATLPVAESLDLPAADQLDRRARPHDDHPRIRPRRRDAPSLISVVLVILVVFFFLRNVRATLIPSVAVPVSLIGTFGVMYLFGYSIDNLSLMALTISTGFVVDDAIVVIENISPLPRTGHAPDASRFARRAAKSDSRCSRSASRSWLSFIPILLMGGIVGRLFREFAVTLSVAILVSLLVSLTTTPMMCARLLKHETARRPRPPLPSQRSILQLAAPHLRHDSHKSCSSIPPSRSSFSLITIAVNVYLARHRSQRLFPAAGQRHRLRRDYGRAGHFVSVHASSDAALRQHRSRPIPPSKTSWPSPAAAAPPTAASSTLA